MTFLARWVLVLAACLIGATRGLELDGVPQCAVSCLLNNLKQTSCLQTDTECLCDDAFYIDLSTDCVKANCTIHDALTTKNITATTCNEPVRNADNVINVSRAIILVFKSAFVFVRLAIKMAGISSGWGWDDYTLLVAFLVSIGMTATSFLEQKHGEGRDIWTLEFDHVSKFLKYFLVFEILYVVTIGLLKSSLIFFYLRHFKSGNVRLALQLTQMFNFFVIMAFGAATLLQCQPLNFFWAGWDQGNIEDLKTGSCINMNAFTSAHAGINIALDIWLMAIPLTQWTWMRSLHGSQKFGAFCMFGAGIFLTVIGIMRLQSLRYIAHSANMTHDYFGVLFWSSAEVGLGLVLLCLPAFRLLFTKVLLSLFIAKGKHSLGSNSRPDDGKKLISKPINKGPLPENADWGFPKKHGYYNSSYDDWDDRVHIDWKGGPRDWNPNVQPQNSPAELMGVSEKPLMEIKVSTASLPNPLTPPSATCASSGRLSPMAPNMDGSLLMPTLSNNNGQRETLQSWKEKRDTYSTRNTWRSTLGWRERSEKRETNTSRIGEIKIMIDKAILRSDSNSTTPDTGPGPPSATNGGGWI